MTTTGRSTVVGVFPDRDSAERAIRELERAGFPEDDIGLAAHGEGGTATGAGPAGLDTTDEGRRGLAAGAAIGGTAGGIMGALAAGLIPGIGPIIGAGILAATVAGAATGAAVGGLWLGPLVDLGVPEDEARGYEQHFRAGRSLVVVRAGSRLAEATDILERSGAIRAEQQNAS